jgi:hypothetical protein
VITLLAASAVETRAQSEGVCSAMEVDVAKVQELRNRIKDLLESSEEARWLDDGDFTLNRFLVSRSCDVQKAESMFRSTVEWRSRYNIRNEFEAWQNSESQEKHLARMYGYASRAGFTEDGIPLNFERYCPPPNPPPYLYQIS